MLTFIKNPQIILLLLFYFFSLMLGLPIIKQITYRLVTRNHKLLSKKLPANITALFSLLAYERLILNKIGPQIKSPLIPQQAGFRQGKSCTGQVLNLTQHIEDGFEKKNKTGVVLLDVSAAYDNISHRLLLEKSLKWRKTTTCWKFWDLWYLTKTSMWSFKCDEAVERTRAMDYRRVVCCRP